MPSELGTIKVGDRLVDLITGEKYKVKNVYNVITLSPIKEPKKAYHKKAYHIDRDTLERNFRHVWQFEFDKQLKELLNGV